MTMMDELIVLETWRSAHEINRRVPHMEHDLALLEGVRSSWEPNGVGVEMPVSVQSSDAITSEITPRNGYRSNGSRTGQPAQPPPATAAVTEPQLVTRRGRQRTPTSRLMAVLCRIGIHRYQFWEQWDYVAGGNCTQGRGCGRCGSVHVRTKHQRNWHYIVDTFVLACTYCRRCSALSGSRTRHEEWSKEWDAGRDRRAHKCLRCGVVEHWSVDDD